MAELFGFYCARNAGFDSFLYQVGDDNSVTDQVIGVTDGLNTGFQAYKSFGDLVEPCYAIKAVTSVTCNGITTQNPVFNPWGYTGLSGGPGFIFLPSVYPAGHQITATFSYYYPCRFDADSCDFEEFGQGLYKVNQLTFTSIK